MTTKKLTKLLALYLPYILLGLAATNFGEAWRLAEGKELGDKIMSMMGTIPVAFANPLPSLHPLDLLVGLCCGAGLRLAVYLRGKNAKKYRHGMEYGSARWLSLIHILARMRRAAARCPRPQKPPPVALIVTLPSMVISDFTSLAPSATPVSYTHLSRSIIRVTLLASRYFWMVYISHIVRDAKLPSSSKR